jgi:hypothetical protein
MSIDYVLACMAEDLFNLVKHTFYVVRTKQFDTAGPKPAERPGAIYEHAYTMREQDG